MATTVNIKKILHRPQWEPCTPAPVTNAAGMTWRSLKLDSYNINFSLMVTSNSAMYFYDPNVDSYVQVAAPGTAFSGTFGASVVARIHPLSISRTATAGTTSTITTNITITRDLRNYKIRITGGPVAVGQELAILSNTIGANSVITVATQALAFSASTTYQLITPNVYMVGVPSATNTNVFQRYDWALNTWSVLSPTGLPAAGGTDGILVATPGLVGGAFDSSATGGYTFSASDATTMTITGPSWTANQWTNYQIRITGGTGAGQVRTIASNTGTVITVSSAWTANPDGTSTWVIEGNDDYLYLLGYNAVTMYRYSISGNTWSTMAPTVARSVAPAAGMSASWVYGCTDAAWTNKNAILNGRYIYSFRGGNSTLQIFDIAGGTSGAGAWADRTYGNQQETFTTGNVWEYDGRDCIYGVGPTGRGYRFIPHLNTLEPVHALVYPQGTATVGDKLILVPYVDGATRIDFLYHWRNTGTEVFRTPVSLFTY
jgi:hypothetical protein